MVKRCGNRQSNDKRSRRNRQKNFAEETDCFGQAAIYYRINAGKARARLIKDVGKAWKLSGTAEELNLIVLDADEKKRVYKSELRRIFPEGIKFLPKELQPREIYSTTRNGMRKVQYIGKAERFGFNFVLFRLL